MKTKAGAMKGTAVVLSVLLTGSLRTASAQCENKTGFAKKACMVSSAVHASSANGKTQAGSAPVRKELTTGLLDAIHPDTLPPSVSPKLFKPLLKLERTDDGAFILRRGFYEAVVESYYFENNNDASARTGAFFPAPILGERATIIAAVLKQSELDPDIAQGVIEQLLQSIYSGSDLEKMPQPVQQAVLIILPREMAMQLKASVQAKSVNQDVMSILNNRLGRASGTKSAGQPAPIAPAAPAQTALPDTETEGPGDNLDLPAVRGTWAQMPSGFYVRYLPDGWAHTRIQVMVPDALFSQADPKHSLTFDPTQFLAILSQLPAQRLGITLRQTDAARR